MNRMWVVVADASSARLFSTRAPGAPLQFLERLEHPAGRMHASELVSDRQGQSQSDTPAGIPHGFAAHTPPRDVEAARFAHQIAARLEVGGKDRSYQHLALVMAPRMLGQVRDALSPKTRAAVALTLEHRLVDVTVEELERRLREARLEQSQLV